MRNLILITLFAFNCLNIQAQLFKEVSDSVGVDYIYPGHDYQEVGAGVTVFDVNNDGWDDIFQSCGIFPSKLWLNQEGKFIDASKDYNLEIIKGIFVQGVFAADYNNDGYEDLFIANMGKMSILGDHSPPILLKNIQGKKFEKIEDLSFNEVAHYPCATWGDINNDGWIDLYLLSYLKSMANGYDSVNNTPNSYIPVCLENKLFINEKGKSFKEVGASLGLNDNGCGLAASFTDYDNDNDIDLILLNDFASWNHKGNRIFRNEYPKLKLKDVTSSLGFYNEFYGMGVGPGDVNNDGLLDYYLTNIGENYFYLNKKDTMVEQSKKSKIDMAIVKDSLTGTSWSGLFLDVENDGDVDLFVSKGFLPTFEPVVIADPNAIFINEGKGVFKDVSKGSGIDDLLVHRGAATLDYDHDGDLDVVCGLIKMNRSEFAKKDQKIKLFRNENKEGNNWIGIKLVGGKGVNKSCVGCSVTISDDKNGTQIREVDGGTGHSSQSTKTLYFGLGNNTSAKNIIIQWLGKEKTKIEELKAGSTYLIEYKGKKKKLY